MSGGRVPDARLGTGSVTPFEDGAAGVGGGGHAGQIAARSLEHQQKEGGVSSLFFSALNVEALQDAIRYRVYVESGADQTVIGRQSDVELSIIMRSIFLQEARNNARESIVLQVKALNASVLAYCVPRILEEVRTYVTYRRDVSTLPEPLPRGEFLSVKGQKTLMMPTGF